jgi:hypothetical protein
MSNLKLRSSAYAQKPVRKIFLCLLTLIIFIVAQTAFSPQGYSFNSNASVVENGKESEREELDCQFEESHGALMFVDHEANSFAIFSNPQLLDIPVVIGRLEWSNGGPHLVPTREIQRVGDLYVLRDPKDTSFLEVTERLPEGGFGRLLRYRGFSVANERVDFEFVYQDRDDTVTILDHAKGKFFRTKFVKVRPDPLSVAPLSVEMASTAELTAVTGGSVKFLIRQGNALGSVIPQEAWFHSRVDALNEQQVWMNRLVRGPPAEGAAL